MGSHQIVLNMVGQTQALDTWIVPAYVNTIYVTMWCSGSGAYPRQSYSVPQTGGGGSGFIGGEPIPVTPGNTILAILDKEYDFGNDIARVMTTIVNTTTTYGFFVTSNGSSLLNLCDGGDAGILGYDTMASGGAGSFGGSSAGDGGVNGNFYGGGGGGPYDGSESGGSSGADIGGVCGGAGYGGGGGASLINGADGGAPGENGDDANAGGGAGGGGDLGGFGGRGIEFDDIGNVQYASAVIDITWVDGWEHKIISVLAAKIAGITKESITKVAGVSI